MILQEFKAALRSLGRAKGLAITVVVTLALGIGANAAIVSLVRAVLLKPLVNREESRILYIRQSAPGIGAENTTFSVPEIQDMRERVRSLTSLAEFSTVTFTMVGLGEPRQVRSGVVNGTYFEVMGLRPILGRLLNAQDDGPSAEGAAVLTYRFWATGLQSDPSVLGKTIRLGTRSATIVGVLEPSVPYPAETEIIANVVTSPHHLSATMVTGREHRMTEVFGRLAPKRTVESALTELRGVHGGIVREFPGSYSPRAGFQLSAVRLRDQITARARTILWVLLAASVLVFLIAVSNVANLILARTVRREGELAVRAALGGSNWALRRTLLAESLLLCGTGAALGLLIAQPMTSVLARYASRYSVRALDLTLDASFLAVAAVLALVAAVLLAFVPRLPSGDSSRGFAICGRQRPRDRRDQPPAPGVCGDADRAVVRAACRSRHAAAHLPCAAGHRSRASRLRACSPSTCRSRRTAEPRRRPVSSTARCRRGCRRCPAWNAWPSAASCPGATAGARTSGMAFQVDGAGPPRRRGRSACAQSIGDTGILRGARRAASWPAATSTSRTATAPSAS